MQSKEIRRLIHLFVSDKTHEGLVAYTKLYPYYTKWLVKYADSQLHLEGESEDIVQDLMVNVWEHRELLVEKGITTKEELDYYLFSELTNIIANLNKKNKRNVSFEEVFAGNSDLLPYLEDTGVDSLEMSEYEQIVYTHAKHKLPSLLKQVFFLDHEKGYKNKEIARMIGVSKNTVVKYKRMANEMVESIVRKYYGLD